jgi:ribosome-associated protein
LIKALHKPKPRRAIKVSRTAKAARLETKKIQAEKKEARKRNFDY